MFEFKIEPRLSETDGMGHISNTVLPVWFEEARKDIFRIFNPSMKANTWNLILRKYEIEILSQIFHTSPVMIKTYIEKIGGKSFTVKQIAIQDNVEVAVGKTVLVHFDYSINKTSNIPEKIKVELKEHLM